MFVRKGEVRVLGNRLRMLRERANMTQEQVAKRLGITRPAYTQYETGVRNPDPDTLARLADVYGVSTDYILGRTSDPNDTIQSDLELDEEWRDLIRQIRELGTELEATALLRSATQMSKEQLRDILKVFQMIKKDREQE